MRKGSLSQYLQSVAVKRLRPVEVDPYVSNQHEFNGVSALKAIFGEGRRETEAQFLYLADDEANTISATSALTWYDSREQQPTRSSEFRLYFQSNPVMERAVAGDLLVVALRPKGEVAIVVTEGGSTSENQILWLLGIEPPNGAFKVQGFDELDARRLGLSARLLLEQLGLEVEPDGSEDWLDRLAARFGPAFPTTRLFSSFARETAPEVDSIQDPDAAVMTWIEHEERLFRIFENHLVSKRLRRGFTAKPAAEVVVDVEGFISFSLSVQNRRKSRVGYALENHLEQVFADASLRFSRGRATEGGSKPDFLFPGINEYRDAAFPASRLRMLGVKSTCKDRWRQVLEEADRIPAKHLFTLETAITEPQTNQMKSRALQLVLPKALHATYLPRQRSQLQDLRSFVLDLQALQR